MERSSCIPATFNFAQGGYMFRLLVQTSLAISSLRVEHTSFYDGFGHADTHIELLFVPVTKDFYM